MRTPGPKFRLMCRTRAGPPLTPPGPRRPHPCDHVTVLELVGGAPARGRPRRRFIGGGRVPHARVDEADARRSFDDVARGGVI